MRSLACSSGQGRGHKVVGHLAHSFGQGGGCGIVTGGSGEVDEMGRWLVCSSGQGGGHKMVAGIGDYVRSQWEVKGCLVCLFGQGRWWWHGRWSHGATGTFVWPGCWVQDDDGGCQSGGAAGSIIQPGLGAQDVGGGC